MLRYIQSHAIHTPLCMHICNVHKWIYFISFYIETERNEMRVENGIVCFKILFYAQWIICMFSHCIFHRYSCMWARGEGWKNEMSSSSKLNACLCVPSRILSIHSGTLEAPCTVLYSLEINVRSATAFPSTRREQHRMEQNCDVRCMEERA